VFSNDRIFFENSAPPIPEKAERKRRRRQPVFDFRPPRSLPFAVLVKFQNPMSGIPVSIRLQKEPLICPQCGSASRIGRSLCLSCLLAQGLSTPRQAEETLEDVLGELDVRDA